MALCRGINPRLFAFIRKQYIQAPRSDIRSSFNISASRFRTSLTHLSRPIFTSSRSLVRNQTDISNSEHESVLDGSLWQEEDEQASVLNKVIGRLTETSMKTSPPVPLSDIRYRPKQRMDRRIGLTRKIQSMLVRQKARQPENPRISKVAIIGAPNAGKSTLTNKLLNWKVSAVSDKVHTTRHRTIGVLTEGDRQVVFLDTPGMLTPERRKKHHLEHSLLTDPHSCLFEADLIVVVVDTSLVWERHQLPPDVLKVLHLHRHKKTCLVLNKVDVYPHKAEILHTTRMLTEGVVGGSEDWFRPIHKPKLKKDRIQQLFDDVDNQWQQEHSESTSKLPARKPSGDLNMEAPFDVHSEWKSGKTPSEDGLNSESETTRSESLDEKMYTLSQTLNRTKQQTQQDDVLNKSLKKLLKNAPKPKVQDFRLYFDSISKDMIDSYEENKKHKGKEYYELIKEERTVDEDLIRDLDEEDKEELQQEIANVEFENMHVFSSEKCAISTASAESIPVEEEPYERLKLTHPFRVHTADGKQKGEKIREFHGYYHLDLKAIADQIEGKKGFDGFDRVFCTSALTGLSVDDLKEYLLESTRPGPWEFDGSVVTDSDPLEMAEMCVREALLNHFSKRIPYSVAVKVKSWGESEDGLWCVQFDIVCPTRREKTVLLSNYGAVMSSVAQYTKQELMNTFRTEILVKIRVRIKDLDLSKWVSCRQRKRFRIKHILKKR